LPWASPSSTADHIRLPLSTDATIIAQMVTADKVAKVTVMSYLRTVTKRRYVSAIYSVEIGLRCREGLFLAG